jgi:hypothetical protein
MPHFFHRISNNISYIFVTPWMDTGMRVKAFKTKRVVVGHRERGHFPQISTLALSCDYFLGYTKSCDCCLTSTRAEWRYSKTNKKPNQTKKKTETSNHIHSRTNGSNDKVFKQFCQTWAKIVPMGEDRRNCRAFCIVTYPPIRFHLNPEWWYTHLQRPYVPMTNNFNCIIIEVVLFHNSKQGSGKKMCVSSVPPFVMGIGIVSQNRCSLTRNHWHRPQKDCPTQWQLVRVQQIWDNRFTRAQDQAEWT